MLSFRCLVEVMVIVIVLRSGRIPAATTTGARDLRQVPPSDRCVSNFLPRLIPVFALDQRVAMGRSPHSAGDWTRRPSCAVPGTEYGAPRTAVHVASARI